MGFGLASVLMAAPPFGTFGWAHPLTAAGVIFPGTGWGGAMLTVAALLALTTRFWRGTALAVSVAWLWTGRPGRRPHS
ncbi:hypothetical protein NWI01_35630 [Nitrobacter winogradskyi]|uniref:Uncharacterized protein n=1 Tax=Nitrobacter winogradskyi TaxID=913 RepID=A0A4Y3WHJ2_NITWI|nr:hypothetical protein NWI01_35630 [Nitrobacter winogradskyi]